MGAVRPWRRRDRLAAGAQLRGVRRIAPRRCRAVDDRQIPLAQIILTGDEGFSPQRLVAAGFAHLADLLYLAAEVGPAMQNSPSPTPTREISAAVAFEPATGPALDRLAAIIEQTYAGTRDCPALDGNRPMDDVLAGYRAQGRHLPDQWYLVRNGYQHVGALLLADHPQTGNWELVYMGVVRAARGAGVGDSIVRFALEAAARGGAQRLVLAVDAANSPAIALYSRWGFREWERRVVYARLACAVRRPLALSSAAHATICGNTSAPVTLFFATWFRAIFAPPNYPRPREAPRKKFSRSPAALTPLFPGNLARHLNNSRTARCQVL